MNNLNIITLTKEIALKYASDIVEVHNLIPFQNWTKDNFLLERDDKRFYKNKWQESSVCFSDSTITGICITFEDCQSNIFGERNFLYLHRIAVLPQSRLKGIGLRLIRHSCKSFQSINQIKNNTNIIVSTPIISLNNLTFVNAENFYLRLGFIKIGEKRYKEKIDSVLKANVSIFIQ